MAIVNRTPDSFYDKGATFADAAALDAIGRAVAAGADIVDIGGVKAGPGPEVDTAAEIARVVPIVQAARAAHPAVVISVDTWRADAAAACLEAGADLVNHPWGAVEAQLLQAPGAPGAAAPRRQRGGGPPRPPPAP